MSDTVDLLEEVERSFQVVIQDEEASAIITVGDFYNCLIAKLGPPESHLCMTSHVFYRIRRALIQPQQLLKKQMAPSTSMESLIEQKERIKVWRDLSNSAGLRLPQLCRPTWMENLILGSFLSLLLVGLLLCCFVNLWGLVVLVLSFLLLKGGYQFTEPFAVCIPSGCSTVGDAAKVILSMNFGRVLADKGSWNPKEAWDALQLIFVWQIGISPEKVTKEAKLVADLSID